MRLKNLLRIGRRAAAAIGIAVAAVAGADAEVTAFWSEHDDANPAVIDHAPWQALLTAYLRTDHPSGVARFDYAALKASAEDTARLAAYLEALQAVDPRRYARAEQLAYWINFYNALTVRLVAAAFPIASIRDIGESWLLPGPWKDENATVAGQALTLHNIEHDILRPIWGDSRIHYAVNCASYGCPNLMATAFTAANASELMAAGARAYVNHPRGVAFDGEDVTVSSIYDWFQEDFGDSEAGVLAHLLEYAEAPLAERLRRFDGDMAFAYDWALNAP